MMERSLYEANTAGVGADSESKMRLSTSTVNRKKWLNSIKKHKNKNTAF